MKKVKYFSKQSTPQETKQFSEITEPSIDGAVVKTLCNVVDGLQAKVAEMADELAKLKETNAEVVQNASTEEVVIEEPKTDPIQPPAPIPEAIVEDEPKAEEKEEYTAVPEDTIIAQFSTPRPKAYESNGEMELGKESFNCLFD